MNYPEDGRRASYSPLRGGEFGSPNQSINKAKDVLALARSMNSMNYGANPNPLYSSY